MRMRRKRNLEPRMEACGDLLVARGRPCLNLKEAAENYRMLLDFKEIFGNANPVRLEVGCGNGKFVAELARRMGTTPQNFNSKMKRESFTISDLEYLAEVVGCSFERHFVLPDGEKV